MRSTGTSAEENIVGIITVVNRPGILVKVLPTSKSYLYYFKIVLQPEHQYLRTLASETVYSLGEASPFHYTVFMAFPSSYC